MFFLMINKKKKSRNCLKKLALYDAQFCLPSYKKNDLTQKHKSIPSSGL